MGRKTLVIDDNRAVLHSLEDFLEATGFRVTTFDSADAVLGELSDHKLCEFEFVVTDLEMPGTKGDEFAVQMHLLNPDCKIFIISAAITKVSLEAAQIATLIEKPFSPARLVSQFRASENNFTSDSIANSRRTCR